MWQGKYKMTVSTIKGLAPYLAEDKERFDTALRFVQMIIDHIIANNCNFSVRMPWDVFDQRELEMNEIQRTRFS